MLRTAIMAAVLATAGAATAEEFGRITASLDGETRDWFTISMNTGSGLAATATFSAGPMSTSDLSLQAHPRPSFTSTDVLSVETMFLGGRDALRQMGVSVMYLPEGMRGPYWQSDGAPNPATVSIDTLDLAGEGEIGRATGSFEAEICPQDSPTSPLDTTRCKRISGMFDTRLLME